MAIPDLEATAVSHGVSAVMICIMILISMNVRWSESAVYEGLCEIDMS